MNRQFKSTANSCHKLTACPRDARAAGRQLVNGPHASMLAVWPAAWRMRPSATRQYWRLCSCNAPSCQSTFITRCVLVETCR